MKDLLATIELYDDDDTRVGLKRGSQPPPDTSPVKTDEYKYPKGNKAPINLLKLGVSMIQIGEKDQGCKMINGVELQYPKANQSVIQKAKYESKKFECIKEDS